jgi:hypothetical protein
VSAHKIDSFIPFADPVAGYRIAPVAICGVRRGEIGWRIEPSPSVAAKMPKLPELVATEIEKTLGGGNRSSPKVTLRARVGSAVARIIHEPPAAISDLAVLSGVLGSRTLRRTDKYASGPSPCGCPVARPSPLSRYGVSCIMRASQVEARDENNRFRAELYIPISLYTELRVPFSRNYYGFQEVKEEERTRGVGKAGTYRNREFRFFRGAHHSILK